MATHSSVLAWRIPGTGEPGGLPSMGSHRVGHEWSNLAAAAAATDCSAPWIGPEQKGCYGDFYKCYYSHIYPKIIVYIPSLLVYLVFLSSYWNFMILIFFFFAFIMLSRSCIRWGNNAHILKNIFSLSFVIPLHLNWCLTWEHIFSRRHGKVHAIICVELMNF